MTGIPPEDGSAARSAASPPSSPVTHIPSIRKWIVTGVVTGLVCGVIVGITPLLFSSFFGTFTLLDSLKWFYADLSRDCGPFCIQVTPAGFLALFLFFVISGFLSGWICYLLHRLVKRFKALSLVATVVLTPVVFYALSMGVHSIGPFMPKTPIAFRCSAVLKENAIYDAGDALFGGRAACVAEIAGNTNDVSWCERIDDTILRSWCVGKVAKNLNDPSLCDDPDLYKPSCVDLTVKDVSASAESLPGQALDEEKDLGKFKSLTAFPYPGQSGWNFFPGGDVEKEPKLV